MRIRHTVWEVLKAFVLTIYYTIRLDWKYDPRTGKYWPSGRPR